MTALALIARERMRILSPAVFVCLAAYIAGFGTLGIVPPAAVTFDLAVLAGLGVLTWAVVGRRVPLRWTHAASAATLWAPIAATLAPLWATHDDAYATLYVMQIASAGVLLDTRWMAATLAVANAIAIAVLLAIGGPKSLLLISIVATATLFAVLIHVLMRRAIVNAETMRYEFSALLESSPEPMFIHGGADADLAIRWANPSMLRLLGYERTEELVGRRSIETFVHPEDRARLIEHRAGVHRGELLSGIDVRWVRRDGNARHVKAESRSVTFAGGAAWLVVARDMTDQIERERERAVAEAAIRKSEEQLRQVQRMEAVGQLAGGIAHDFNNLLAAILSNANLVAEELGDGHPLLPEIRDIEAATERAAALTRQLLAYSRKQPRKVAEVALNALVTNFEKMLSRLVSEDIELRPVLAPQLGTVRADANQLEQVLLNLVVNARDAMPTGGRLAIETANVELDEARAAELGTRSGRHVVLSVSDTGCGMSAETQARIFEPFFTTKPVGKGTGLGLATVFGVVKQNDGGIAVESEVGRGTTFRIYLPRVDAVVVASADAQPRQAPRRGTETILLVEDDPFVRAAVRRQLRSFGYRLLEAGDPASALELAAAHAEPIDLLLTDLVMPGMDGRRLASRLLATRTSTKVLFMSGYTEHAAVTSAAFGPSDRLISKPFTALELSQAIREVLDRDAVAGPQRRALDEVTAASGEHRAERSSRATPALTRGARPHSGAGPS